MDGMAPLKCLHGGKNLAGIDNASYDKYDGGH